MSSAGNFKIDVWTGSPIRCTLHYRDTAIVIDATELSDLIYAARKALEQVNAERDWFKEPPLATL